MFHLREWKKTKLIQGCKCKKTKAMIHCKSIAISSGPSYGHENETRLQSFSQLQPVAVNYSQSDESEWLFSDTH